MDQWVKYLPHTQSSGVQILSTHKDAGHTQWLAYNPRLWELEYPWSMLASQTSRIDELWVQVRDLASICKSGSNDERHQCQPLPSTSWIYMHACLFTHIHLYAHGLAWICVCIPLDCAIIVFFLSYQKVFLENKHLLRLAWMRRFIIPAAQERGETEDYS